MAWACAICDGWSNNGMYMASSKEVKEMQKKGIIKNFVPTIRCPYHYLEDNLRKLNEEDLLDALYKIDNPFKPFKKE